MAEEQEVQEPETDDALNGGAAEQTSDGDHGEVGNQEPETIEQKVERLEKLLEEKTADFEKYRNRNDKRIGQVVQRKNHFKEELYKTREELLALKTPGQAPTLEQFGNDPLRYIDAKSKYEQAVSSNKQELENLHAQRHQAEAQEFSEYLRDRIEEEFGGDAETLAAIHNSSAPVDTDMLGFMARMPDGAKMVKHFATYPTDAAFIRNLPPDQRPAAMMGVVNFVRSQGSAPVAAQKPAVVPPIAKTPAPPPQAGGRMKPNTAQSDSLKYFESIQKERQQRNQAALAKRRG